MNWTPLRSTFLKSCHYDADSRVLIVQFKDWKMERDYCAYSGVPPEVAEEFILNSHDAGAAFNRLIKDRYSEVPTAAAE